MCAESRRSMCRNDGIGEPRICPQSTASGDAWGLEKELASEFCLLSFARVVLLLIKAIIDEKKQKNNKMTNFVFEILRKIYYNMCNTRCSRRDGAAWLCGARRANVRT